jgi:histidine decarboxylase
MAVVATFRVNGLVGTGRSSMMHDDVGDSLELFRDRLQRGEVRKVGFPGWSRPLEPELMPFFDHELNNYGDPDVDPVYGWHTKAYERKLREFLCDLFDAPPGDRWGYVTGGGSEGILHGLRQGRSLCPDAPVYYSTAAHGCVANAVEILDRRGVLIDTDDRGEMNYDTFARRLRTCRSAIVVATVGTTLTEAVDDVTRIRLALRDAGVDNAYIHADAALSGIPLAVQSRPVFGLGAGGVDSLSISGHKFFGVPWPCGLVLTRRSIRDRINAEDSRRHGATANYTGSSDRPTIGASRNGHSALVMWYRLKSLGVDGLHDVSERGVQTAAYAERALTAVGWDAWRSHPLACTVVIKTPPPAMLQHWPLATVGGLSHIVCTPAVTTDRIDAFVNDLNAVALGRRSAV